MRLLKLLLILSCLALTISAHAATGRLIKVLPHFLDHEGRHALTPSLYDRDAYQFFLRQHPDKRGAIRFDVQWKAKGESNGPLTLRVELRGIPHGDFPREALLEKSVEPGGWFSHWTGLSLGGSDYKNFGEVTAWRVTLWEGENLLSEQKSFLW